MAGTLNPELYDALKRVFMHVKIVNPGVRMMANYVEFAGKVRLNVLYPGEEFVVCCPFCPDTGFHLYINHRWGVRDRKTKTRNLWLANCYHGCLEGDWDQRMKLARMVISYNGQAYPEPVEVKLGSEVQLPARVRMPFDFKFLNELPKDHPACVYITKRGFSPVELSETWGVGFAVEAFERNPPGRVIIPLLACQRKFENPAEVLESLDAWDTVAYQGRYLGEPPTEDVKKYLIRPTGIHKSHFLYGLFQVGLDDSPIFVCEGPADVWRAGPGAVAIWGNSISDVQCKLLRQMVPGRDIVVMLDPDAAKEAEKVASRIREVLDRDLTSGKEPGRVVVAKLPDSHDPGDCTYEEILAAAQKALRRPKRRQKS